METFPIQAQKNNPYGLVDIGVRRHIGDERFRVLVGHAEFIGERERVKNAGVLFVLRGKEFVKILVHHSSSFLYRGLAPLDDTNISRFNRFVNRFLKKI